MSNINVTNFSQEEVLSEMSNSLWKKAAELYEVSDIDSLGRKGRELARGDDDEVSDIDSLGRKGRELARGDDDYYYDDTLSELSLGSVEEEEQEEEEQEEEEEEETASEIAAKTYGGIIREEARKRIEENSELYEGLPRDDMNVLDTNELYRHFDWDAEGAQEWMDAIMLREQEIAVKEHDIYLANGGITNQELPYLIRRLKEKRII